MKKYVTRVGPLRAGIVLGVLYRAMGLVIALILCPVMFLSTALAGKMAGTAAVGGAVAAVLILVALPIFYGVIGFVGGVAGSAIYNLVASWTGGLEFEVRDGV